MPSPALPPSVPPPLPSPASPSRPPPPPPLYRSARASVLSAWHNHGLAHLQGLGPLCASPASAAPHFSRAAAAGHIPSLLRLAALYEHGSGVAHDLARAFTLYSRAAARGAAPAAEIALARLYRYGRGVPKDAPRAVNLLRSAIAAGCNEGRVALAECYTAGAGVPKDPAEALRLYKLAAQNGSQLAKVRFAECLQTGAGVSEKDDNAAFQSYWDAATAGEKEAFFPLAVCFEHGSGVDKCMSSAFEWYRRAADLAADPRAKHVVADFFFDGVVVAQNRPAAIPYYVEAAATGLAASRTALGDCYLTGTGIERDEKRAVEWFRAAVGTGYADAFIALAECYLDGRGVDVDKGKGLYLLERAVALDSVHAHSTLADRFFYGRGLDRDLSRAVVHYRKAADAGSVPDQLALANCYFHTRGVARDCAKAVEYYRRAAEAGCVTAAVRLAHCFMRGMGVAEDAAKACELYQKASAVGNDEAKLSLAHCYRLGKGCVLNLNHARNLLLEMSEADHPLAIRHLAMFYSRGLGVGQDFAKAASLYKEASDLGDAVSTRILANYHRVGRGGTKKSLETAFKMYGKAVQQGDAIALVNIAQMYERGCGMDQCPEKAVLHYETLLNNGNDRVQGNLLGCYSKVTGNENIAKREFAFLQSLYDGGRFSVGRRLAFMHYNGRGVPINFPLAVSILQQTLDKRKSASSMELLALCYLQGRGITRDLDKGRSLLCEAQKLGKTSAKTTQALCLAKGLLGDDDKDKTLVLLNEAVEAGSVRACVLLGDYYYRGHFEQTNGKICAMETKPNFEQAVRCYQLAKECSAALFRLFLCHRNGRGVPESQRTALSMLEKAATMGCPHSQSALCPYLEAGANGWEKDLNKALIFHENAVSRLSGRAKGRAMYNFGLFLENSREKLAYSGSPADMDDRVRALFQEASDEGIGQATNDLAVLLERRVDLDNEEEDETLTTSDAFSLFHEAAETGVVTAEANVGICYEMGIGTYGDIIKAKHYYERAVMRGDPVAGNNLALILEEAQDYNRAASLLENAAARGNSNAKVNLGRIREKGQGVERDLALAFQLYSEAAQIGNSDGRFNVASCYECGIGTSKDRTLALRHYRVAASMGHTRARERVELYGIDAG